MEKTKFNISGMSCAACSARVEKAVSKIEGVETVAVSLLTNTMSVEGTARSEAIVKAVEDAGYGAEIVDLNKGQTHFQKTGDLKPGLTPFKKSADEVKVLRNRLIASLVFLCALMYMSMGHMMWGWPLPEFFDNNHVAMGLAQMLLTIVIMIINKKFFVSGMKSLMHRSPNMDALVSLGAGAAFIYSTVMLFIMTDAQVKGGSMAAMPYMHEFYFESAGTILTLITLGKLLEAKSKGKTTDALRGLLELAPDTALVLKDEAEVEVPAEDVQIGDIFVVKPGASIPVDGKVIEGASSIDESSLTGESVPVDKQVGDVVKSGTMNTAGFLKCEATRVGEDTTLSQIIALMSDAAATKAPISKVADRVSGVFVPVVIFIAIVTTAIWLLVGQSSGYALARGISVLVISCPCALGLATPVAIMVGSGKGAKNGILFKTAVSLEQTGKAEIVALDKTGTITEGKPVVTNIITTDDVSVDELLKYAVSLEAKSEHPLAKAIITYGSAINLESLEVSDFVAEVGKGLKGKIGDYEVYGGNSAYVEQEVCKIDSDLIDKANSLANEGQTPLFFGVKPLKPGLIPFQLGVISVADTIKADSKEAISSLKKLGIRTVMLTGDRPESAETIRREAGVDEVHAGLLPADKERIIRELSESHDVLMVGDGINDAPALASASVGVAIGAGADVAIDAADVVLMNSSLSDVVRAIRLSRATLTNIHENLFWAFIYNVIGIPLAAGWYVALLGWSMNPMFGALAMSLSSFCVVTNALRLNTLKIESDKHDKPRRHLFKRNSEDKTTTKEETMTKTIKITGMMCGHCEKHAHDALLALNGVKSAEVSHEKGEAIITCSAEISDDTIKKAIADEGYEVTSIE